MSREYLILKPTEASIVESLKSLGTSNISNISRRLNIARTSIYSSLKKLVEENLVIKNGFNYSINNRINKVNTPHTTSLLIDQLLKEILNLKQGEIVYSIESDEEIQSLFNNRKKLLDWQKEAVKNKIVLKGIGSTDALDFFQKNMTNHDSDALRNRSGSARFLEDKLSGHCTIISFRDYIYFISRTKKYYFEIKNSYAAEFLQKIIDVVYGYLKYKPIHMD